jgi:transcriptional regulator NrdR family protein
MTCPKCGNKGTEVYDSRKTDKYHGAVRRRRLCPKCYNSWTTFEIQQKHIDSIFGKNQDDLETIRELYETTRKTNQILARNFGSHLTDYTDCDRG